MLKNAPTPIPADTVKLLARRILEKGYDDLPERERHVLERVANRVAVSRDVNIDYDSSRSVGKSCRTRSPASVVHGPSSSYSRQRLSAGSGSTPPSC